MPSVLSAGNRKQLTRTKKPIRMSIQITLDDISYEISSGTPQVSNSKFGLDPEIKSEYIWYGPAKKKTTTYLKREANTTWIMDENGNQVVYPLMLTQAESVLSQLKEPNLYPELFTLREALSSWRF